MSWLEDAILWLDKKVRRITRSTEIACFNRGLSVMLAVIHKDLAELFRRQIQGKEQKEYDRFARVALNDIFSHPLRRGDDVRFFRSYRSKIRDVLKALPKSDPELCREITRALYVRAIIEGAGEMESKAIFDRANKLGIFSPEVSLPKGKEYLHHAFKTARKSGIGGGD